MLIITGAIYYFFFSGNGTPPPASFQEQLQVLEDTQTDLQNLSGFIEQQKAALQRQESIVRRLEDEEKELRPVVEADRDIVAAVLAAEADRRRERFWLELFIAFAVGVASSIVAMFIYRRLRWRNGKEDKDWPTF